MQVEGVNYDINWKAFKRGTSFFVPCLDAPRAKREVLLVTKRLKMKVLIKIVIVESIRGLRVWRM